MGAGKARGATEAPGKKGAAEEVLPDGTEVKGRRGGNEPARPELDVSSQQASSAYRHAAKGHGRRVPQRNATRGSGVHGKSPTSRWGFGNKADGNAGASDGGVSQGLATYTGADKGLVARAWDRVLKFLGSIFDPRYMPNRYNADYLLADGKRTEPAREKEEAVRDEWSENTVPEMLSFGARLSPFFDVRLARVNEVMESHFVFSKNATGETTAEVRDPQEMIRTGREVLDSWSWMAPYLKKDMVRNHLLNKLGLPEYSQLSPDAQKAVDRAVEYVLLDSVVSDVVADHSRLGLDADRAALKQEFLDRARSLGLEKISSDTEMAVDSILDQIEIAREFGILEAEGGLKVEELSEVLTMLYVRDSPQVRIDKAELTHVPLVVRATMNHYVDGYRKSHGGKDPKPEDLRTAFLSALFHDAGKFDLNIATNEGFAVLESANFNGIPLNNTGLRIEVKPGENLDQALSRLSKDDGFLDAMIAKDPSLKDRDQARVKLNDLPLKKFRFLLGVMLHHDSVSVKNMAGRLGMDFGAIRLHGGVSTFILDNSFGGWGIQSNVLKDPKYQNYINLYLAVHAEIQNGAKPTELESSKTAAGRKTVTVEVDGKKRTMPLWKAMRRLRAEFADKTKFSDLDRALLTGDHEGQADVGKYMMILSLQPVNGQATIHELLFGRAGDKADYMTNSVMGVLDTHEAELYTLAPDLSADSLARIDEARRWLEQDLAAALLNGVSGNPKLAAVYGAWKTQNPQGNVIGWLKEVRIKDEVEITLLGPDGTPQTVKVKPFAEIQGAIEPAFNTHMRNWQMGRPD